MKWISVFRAIIDFVYFFSLLAAVASPLILYTAFFENDVAFELGGQTIINKHWSFYIVAVLGMLGYLCFVRMLYLMKKSAWKINKKQLFNLEVASWIHEAGQYCIAAALLTKIPVIIYTIAIRSVIARDVMDTSFKMSFGFGFDTLFVTISFGFFLMLTGIIIKNGLQLKQENDLTI